MGLSPRQGQADVLLWGVFGHIQGASWRERQLGGRGKIPIGICMYATPLFFKEQIPKESEKMTSNNWKYMQQRKHERVSQGVEMIRCTRMSRSRNDMNHQVQRHCKGKQEISVTKSKALQKET